MKFDFLRTRKGKLKDKILYEIESNNPSIDKILGFIDEYEKNNLKTIEKLRRSKKIESKRITGALKQTINAHGPITKDLIGSAGKRILGALLVEKENFITKIMNKLR